MANIIALRRAGATLIASHPAIGKLVPAVHATETAGYTGAIPCPAEVKIQRLAESYGSGPMTGRWVDAHPHKYPWRVYVCGYHIGSYACRADAVRRVRQNYNANARGVWESGMYWSVNAAMKNWEARIAYAPH